MQTKEKSPKEWLDLLSSDYLPWTEFAIKEIEKIRGEWQLPADALALAIIGYSATVKRVQIFTYYKVVGFHTDLGREEILKKTLESRINAGKISGVPLDYGDVNDIIKTIESLEQLCNFIVEKEDKETKEYQFPDVFGLGHKINEILEEEIKAYFGRRLCPKLDKFKINPNNPINWVNFMNMVYKYFKDIDKNTPIFVQVQELVQSQFPQISDEVAHLICLKYGRYTEHIGCFLYWGIGAEEYFKEKLLNFDEVSDLLNNSHIEQATGIFGKSVKLVRDKKK